MTLSGLPQIAQGKFWNELTAGDRFRTHRRTVTEADLVAFVNATGMVEQIFIDADHGGAMGGRPVPAALTYSFIEGFQTQSLIQGTGLALLELEMLVKGPVRVNDSIWAVIEVADVRPTSKGNRAIITFNVSVHNQREDLVLFYKVKRMLAGRP